MDIMLCLGYFRTALGAFLESEKNFYRQEEMSEGKKLTWAISLYEILFPLVQQNL